jgi:hypothetical protein
VGLKFAGVPGVPGTVYIIAWFDILFPELSPGTLRFFNE